jgi:methionyl-tRNA synthetase
MARFKRLDGYDVFFLTGTDEHGQKVADKAAENGMDPKQFADKVSQAFSNLKKALNLSNDDFIRTTEERHYKACDRFWKKLRENNQLYLAIYRQFYAKSDEAYYQEEEVKECSDGRIVGPTGATCVPMEELNYYFKLSDWKDALLKYYDENPDFIYPKTRRAEAIRYVQDLVKTDASGKTVNRDLSVSRTKFKWGIPVPDDHDHVMYVWIDALTNYVTGIGYPDTQSENFQKRWPADLHIIGKDILKFHAVYWPALLMAADLEPPKRIFAHGWWTNKGKKISKSLGNTIDPIELVNTFGVDQTRFFMMHSVPFGKDGNYSNNAMVNCIDSQLSEKLGNLAFRTLSMIKKNCGGKMPEKGPFTVEDVELLTRAQDLIGLVRDDFEIQDFRQALDHIWKVVDASNKFMQEQAPFAKGKDPQRMETILYVLADTLRYIAVLSQPFMPDSMGKLLDQLSVPQEKRYIVNLVPKDAVKSGEALPVPEKIFPRHGPKPLRPRDLRRQEKPKIRPYVH